MFLILPPVGFVVMLVNFGSSDFQTVAGYFNHYVMSANYFESLACWFVKMLSRVKDQLSDDVSLLLHIVFFVPVQLPVEDDLIIVGLDQCW